MEKVQIGEEIVIHDGGSKLFARNFHYNGTFGEKLVDGYSSALSFDNLGDIYLRGSEYGHAGDAIQWNQGLIIKNNGNVGIATTPSDELNVHVHTQGFILNDGPGSSILIGNNSSSTPYGEFGLEYAENNDNSTLPDDLQGLNIWKPWMSTFLGLKNYIMFINNRGNIGIGVDPSILNDDDFRLSVNGGIRATKVKVYTGWADFVFSKKYSLMPLKDLEEYISSCKHLPDIPSSDEVMRNGIDLGLMQSKLLQKVEELTLYIIELQKQNDNLLEIINSK